MAVDPKMIASMNKMYEDIKAGRRSQYDARDYYHNIKIKRLFDRARRSAWHRISSEYAIADIVREQRLKKYEQQQKQSQTANLLNMYR